jgi:hypothetical protein
LGKLVFVLRERPQNVPLRLMSAIDTGPLLRQLKLGLERSGFWSVAACPAGYRAEQDKHSALPKVRFEKKEIIPYLP